MDRQPRFWILRVADGKNFLNSQFPIWGLKRGRNGCQKTIVRKMKPGDVLCFMTSKDFGGKIIGMAEYCAFFDRHEEPLLEIYTKSNHEHHWEGGDDWDIQLHYKNLYLTERQNITGCIQCGGAVLEYETFKKHIQGDLYEHYRIFCYYGEPKHFASMV